MLSECGTNKNGFAGGGVQRGRGRPVSCNTQRKDPNCGVIADFQMGGWNSGNVRVVQSLTLLTLNHGLEFGRWFGVEFSSDNQCIKSDPMDWWAEQTLNSQNLFPDTGLAKKRLGFRGKNHSSQAGNEIAAEYRFAQFTNDRLYL